MQSFKVLLCVLSLNISFNALATDKDGLMTLSKIEYISRKTTQDLSKDMNLNGSILVAKNDEIAYTQQFGFADLEAQTKTSIHTQFFIGSVTKQFAAVALLKSLLDSNIKDGIDQNDVEGLKRKIKFDLNKPVSNFLSQEHYIWDGAMPKWANEITVHQLLIHTSGIIDCARLPNYNDLVKNPPNIIEFVRQFKDKDLEFNPGTKFSYSNSGYILIGEIIEQITGMKLDKYMETAIFKPSEMKSTYYTTNGTVHAFKKDKTRFANLARGYYFDYSADNPILYEVPEYEPMQLVLTSGSIISTTPDLLRWNNYLYLGKIIPPFLVDMMLEPYIFIDSPDIAYGYGVMIMKPGSEQSYYFHGGLTFGYISNLTYIPNSNISVISLSNIMFNWEQLMAEREKLKSEQPSSLNDAEQSKRVKEIINGRYPNIKKFDFMLLDKEIVEKLDAN